MTPQAAKEEGVSAIYELLRVAAARRQPVAAIYGGQSRLLCPHVVGPEIGGWRCLAVEKLSPVELSADAWHTEPRAPRQACVDEIDFDVDAQPGDDPQKGH
jgi:hypothetical protein